MADLNGASFFRKGGLPLEGQHLEVGRDPLTGSWYVEITGKGGQMRSILTPAQAFDLGKGILTSMVRFQPDKIGEVRSLMAALLDHAR